MSASAIWGDIMAKKIASAAKGKRPKSSTDNPGYSAEVLDIIATGDSFSPYASQITIRIKDPKGTRDLRLDHESKSSRLALLIVAATAFSLRRAVDIIPPTLADGQPDPHAAADRVGQLSIGPPLRT